VGGPPGWQGQCITEPQDAERFEVGCELLFDVPERAVLALHVAVASTAGVLEAEDLLVTSDQCAVEVEEIAVERGGRVHLLTCGAGQLAIGYRAVGRRAAVPAPEPDPGERLVALRQSRYCPSDLLETFAATELGFAPNGPERARSVGAWVFRRLAYELGSSGPGDTAVDTLLAGRGVCRDFAHLTVAMCRAIGVPARLVSVYAPGLWPMDFHAVAEVFTGEVWEVVDAARLAPRQSLVRIATGRDAADTAFSTTLSGSAELLASTVMAIVLGDLPFDDQEGRVSLP